MSVDKELMVKNPPANAGDFKEMLVQSLGWGDLLEKGMETHSSILTWRIPWTGTWGSTVHTVAELATTEATQQACKEQLHSSLSSCSVSRDVP